MPYDFDKRLLFYKIETVEGTDAAPVAADAIVTRGLTPVQFEADTRVREIDGQYFGARPEAKNTLRGRTSFEVEIAGGGTATTVPPWMKLLRACGFDAGTVGASSVVQAPISANVPSATLWDYTDTLKQPLLGARGDGRMVFEDDQYPFFAFDFMGFPPTVLLTDAAPVTPSVAAFQTPVLASQPNTTFTLGAFAAELRRLEIAFGSQLSPRSFIGSSDKVKYRNRVITATAVIRAPTLSAKDYFAGVRAGTQIPMQVVHGTAAGNIVQVDAARCETGLITTSEEEGDLMLNVPLRLIPSSAGNDELTITSK